MHFRKKGFTIVELLVVVAVISVLATMIFVNLSKTQANARDSRRMADINEMAKATRLYYEQNNAWPDKAYGNVFCAFPYSAKTNEPSEDRWKEGCLEGSATTVPPLNVS